MRLSTNIIIIAALSFGLAAPALADGAAKTIDCANVTVMGKSIQELQQLHDVCEREHPSEESQSVKQMREWNDVMALYTQSARTNAAQLGMTPAQYMNSWAGRVALSWLALKVYRNTVFASVLMLLSFWFAALAARRITYHPRKWEVKSLFGIIPYRVVTEVNINSDMTVSSWGTLGFAGCALLACGAIYAVLM
jgi:hypothetical protein